MVNNSLEACVLNYEDHQRISCHEQNSSASTIVSQDCGYYDIRSYPFMLVLTNDSQIFGKDWILTTVELAKVIQKSLPEVRFTSGE